jgi:AcrR family transcriptional regulator
MKKRATTYHHGDLRNAIIDMALATIEKDGVNSLSLRDIARQIGVGHNAPYRHFATKTELLEALAAYGFRQIRDSNERAERKHRDAPERQLFEAGMQYLNLALKHPELFKLMFGGLISLHECSDALRMEKDAAILSLVNIIQSGQQASVFASEDVMKLTMAALVMIHGLSVMAISGMLQDKAATPRQISKLAEQIYDVLLMGLKKRVT